MRSAATLLIIASILLAGCLGAGDVASPANTETPRVDRHAGGAGEADPSPTEAKPTHATANATDPGPGNASKQRPHEVAEVIPLEVEADDGVALRGHLEVNLTLSSTLPDGNLAVALYHTITREASN